MTHNPAKRRKATFSSEAVRMVARLREEGRVSSLGALATLVIQTAAGGSRRRGEPSVRARIGVGTLYLRARPVSIFNS